MKGYSRDMFDEMDEVFDRLFANLHREMMAGTGPVSGYRIVIEGSGFPPGEQELPPAGPRITTTPVAEVHRIDNEVKVIAELPGATEESIHLDIQGNKLIIDAGDPDMPYHTAADLPPVDAGSLQRSFRNGVLEVTFQALADPLQKK